MNLTFRDGTLYKNHGRIKLEVPKELWLEEWQKETKRCFDELELKNALLAALAAELEEVSEELNVTNAMLAVQESKLKRLAKGI